MKRQGGGTIINMSSVAGLQAWSGPDLSASKHAIMALTKSLRMKAGPITSRSAPSVQEAVADELVDATADGGSSAVKKSIPYDIAETARLPRLSWPIGGGAPDRRGSPRRGLVNHRNRFVYDLGDGVERLEGMVQERTGPVKKRLARESLGKTADRVIKGHQSHDNMTHAWKQIADKVQPGKGRRQEGQRNDHMQRAEGEISIGREIDHDGRKDGIDEIDRGIQASSNNVVLALTSLTGRVIQRNPYIVRPVPPSCSL